MSNFNQESVTGVHHWTDNLFSFTTTRDPSFRFRNGEFTMIGLKVGEKPLLRAYSVASANYEDRLEFFSIKVPDGPLTSHLQNLQVGDTVLMRKKPTGTLVNDALTPGKRLYMFSTGTGIAPFASLIRDPETYEKFDEVILCHTCREVSELKYGFDLVEEIRNHEFLSEVVGVKLKHYATVTRDANYPHQGRITDNIVSGKLFADLGVAPLDPAVDRGMICGSSAMLKETKQILLDAGFEEGANNKPGEFVIERAFVD